MACEARHCEFNGSLRVKSVGDGEQKSGKLQFTPGYDGVHAIIKNACGIYKLSLDYFIMFFRVSLLRVTKKMRINN